MFPGYVTTYKDEDEMIHLYFFPGIDDDNQPLYRKIDLAKSGVKYDEDNLDDGATDFRFFDKNITSINCKLVNRKTGIPVLDDLKI
jgi:hypothetical protein